MANTVQPASIEQRFDRCERLLTQIGASVLRAQTSPYKVTVSAAHYSAQECAKGVQSELNHLRSEMSLGAALRRLWRRIYAN